MSDESNNQPENNNVEPEVEQVNPEDYPDYGDYLKAKAEKENQK